MNRCSGFVVDGHARVALALARGEATVPVLYVDLDPAEEALVLATLDPIGAMAGRDDEKLRTLLAGLPYGVDRALSAGPTIHWYLATVGTRPDRRREGLASLVIRAGLAACDRAGLPAAVETSNEANCRLYERLGFQNAGDRIAPDGALRVWVLVRPVQG